MKRIRGMTQAELAAYVEAHLAKRRIPSRSVRRTIGSVPVEECVETLQPGSSGGRGLDGQPGSCYSNPASG